MTDDDVPIPFDFVDKTREEVRRIMRPGDYLRVDMIVEWLEELRKTDPTMAHNDYDVAYHFYGKEYADRFRLNVFITQRRLFLKAMRPDVSKWWQVYSGIRINRPTHRPAPPPLPTGNLCEFCCDAGQKDVRAEHPVVDPMTGVLRLLCTRHRDWLLWLRSA